MPIYPKALAPADFGSQEGVLKEKGRTFPTICGHEEKGDLTCVVDYQSGRTLIGETIDVTELSTPGILCIAEIVRSSSCCPLAFTEHIRS